MFLRIEPHIEKTLVGVHIRTSLAENRTTALWQAFMPRRKEIPGIVGQSLFSMEVYDTPLDPATFHAHTPFEKWAAVEVSGTLAIPSGFDTCTMHGMYAVFLHRGTVARFATTAQYIYGTWLPQSGYSLDHRPHFAVMGEAYKNNDPDSEEEIWVPVKRL